MRWIRDRRRLLSLAAVLLGIASIGLQTACDGTRHPTAVAPPDPNRPQPPAPAVQSLSYILLAEPFRGKPYPEAAEVLLDGEVIWEGDIPPISSGYSGYYSYYYTQPSNFSGAVADRPLAPGRHTIAIRITKQPVSGRRYFISGRVDLYWNIGRTQRIATWEQEDVRLVTGATSWESAFFIPETPG